MAKKNLAELLIDTLAAAGVKRIYGLAGDSLNGITDAIRTDERIKWIHVRHEETAAFAAGAEAHLTGTLAVCAGSCGPGNLHLINGLYDANRSRVPVLAIASHIPSYEIGSQYFQETHPESIFRECSHYCELISQAEQMPRVLEIAIQTALARRGVAVVVLPGDVALREATNSTPRLNFPEMHTTIRPSDEEIAKTAGILNEPRKVTIFGGAGCAGAHTELMELAGKLKAPIVYALRGKEFIEYDNPFDVGMLLGDLLSLRQLDLPVKMIVFNNSALAFVELEMKAAGMLDFATGLRNPDFAKLAEAADVLGLRANAPEQVRPLLAQALNHPGPALVEVVIDRQELALPPSIKLDQVKGFSLFMMKAVIDGRGSEVIDLLKTNLF